MSKIKFLCTEKDKKSGHRAFYRDCEESGKSCVSFVFPNYSGIVIHTNKDILAEKSEIFKNQFESPLDGRRNGHIVIEDIPYDAFITMLERILGKSVEITTTNWSELLNASRKYFIHDLTAEVIDYLKSNILLSNAVDYYRFIEKFEIQMLNDHILKICTEDPVCIITSLSSTETDMRLLKMILESPTLKCTEYSLYNAIRRMFMRNHKEQEQMYTDECFRKDMGKLKYLIRFPIMTLLQLLKCITKKPCLLTNEEMVDFQLWAGKKIFTNTVQFYSVHSRHSSLK